jgi:hypothetical protein
MLKKYTVFDCCSFVQVATGSDTPNLRVRYAIMLAQLQVSLPASQVTG